MAFQNGPVDRTTDGTSKGVDKDDLVMPVSKQKPPMRIGMRDAEYWPVD
jgi:hypothetical protein